MKPLYPENYTLRSCKTMKFAGKDPVPVICECKVQKGIGIHLVGLVDTAAKESLLRTVTALQAKGYSIPGKKIIINLAPSDIIKKGPYFDLPIALSLLAASEQEQLNGLEKALVVGELALDGKVRMAPGAILAIKYASEHPDEVDKVIVPAQDLTLLKRRKFSFSDTTVPVYGVQTLDDAVMALKGTFQAVPLDADEQMPVKTEAWNALAGNPVAKRALEIAAAGGHDMILVGAPGCEKATMAKALTEILPMNIAERTETAAVYSVAGRAKEYELYLKDNSGRPFRAPHYSSSLRALLGGGEGDNVLPGEVSLAHNGVLFLDEAGSWPKALMESLRAPIEDKTVKISRLARITEYPADFRLVLGTTPCPCGYYGEGDRCTCTPGQIRAFLSRLSGPVYDRIDLQVWIHPEVKKPENAESEPIAKVAERILRARQAQHRRYGDDKTLNGSINSRTVEIYCRLDDEVRNGLENLITRLGLSVRAYMRILRIARTIADLAGREELILADVFEAASYRFLDKSI